jgi:23S rRNA pseudouridine1911/1915/1917 synthase
MESKFRVSDRLVFFQFNKKEPQRLDKFLVECLPEFSRSQLQQLIRKGLVHGITIHKAGWKLEGNVQVAVHLPPPKQERLAPEPIPLEVIFENQDVLVVNKPAGMVVHPAAGHTDGTLAHAALAHAPEIETGGEPLRQGVVHRLDKLTSGVILLAKNEPTLSFLQNQFRQRLVDKRYLALVDGAPPTPEGRVEAPIAREPVRRKRMHVVPPGKGREAISEYFSRESFPKHTLLEVHPITGRTHQVRVHLAFLGCPVVGDRIYGRKKPSLPLNRHFLHAWQLTFQLPNEREKCTFVAPLPPELEQLLNTLRKHG